MPKASRPDNQLRKLVTRHPDWPAIRQREGGVNSAMVPNWRMREIAKDLRIPTPEDDDFAAAVELAGVGEVVRTVEGRKQGRTRTYKRHPLAAPRTYKVKSQPIAATSEPRRVDNVSAHRVPDFVPDLRDPAANIVLRSPLLKVSEPDRRALLVARRDALIASKSRLIPFARLMMPDPNCIEDARLSLYEADRFHLALADVLERVEANKLRRVIVVCPPRHGKTQLASKIFSAWYAGRHPTRSSIFATYNNLYAVDIGREVREFMMSADFLQLFPEAELRDDSQASDRLQTIAGGLLVFTGRGGTLTGRGGHVLLIDDPLKDAEEAGSQLARDKLWIWYRRVIRTRLMTDEGAIVIITTRWNEDDLVGRLVDPTNAHYDIEEAGRWTVIALPALAEEQDFLGRQPGEALWPSRFSQTYLEELRREDPEGFSALYQGRPSPLEGAHFKQAYIQQYRRQDLPVALRIYAASDQAASSDKSSDRTCMGVAGVDKDNNLYLLPELVWDRLPTNIVVERMVDLMAKYRPLMWWLEAGPMTRALMPFLRRRMMERDIFVALDEVPVSKQGDKRQRAQAILGRMAMGKVFFPTYTSWWGDAKHEMLAFPNAAHDDFVDMLSLFGYGLMKAVHADIKKPGPRVAQPGTFGWVKAQTRRDELRAGLGKDGAGW